MKVSNLLLATARQVPADVEIISHQLMLRAGMIRQLASGIYSWLPTGLRVLRRVENIVREEMNRSLAQEVLMPSVQPGEIWRESGRWDYFGPELLRFKDRHQRDFCLGPTHEEVITTLINHEIRSYKQLPANFYQIQWKFRDEVRPRFGIMRGREFLMKDAYSFDVDKAGMEQSYQVMYDAYARIFSRLNLDFVAVEADSGAIGGSLSHEFHVLAESGEDGIGINPEAGFAANVELIALPAPAATSNDPSESLNLVETPGVTTMQELSQFLSVPIENTVKTLIVKGEDGPIALVARGDHELNFLKAEKIPNMGHPIQMETPENVTAATGAPVGSVGPVGLDIPVYADYSTREMLDFVCGANQKDKHFTGVNWERDVSEVEFCDIRKAVAGDPCPTDSSKPLEVKRGIEVGHVFQLGTKYSEAFAATCLDVHGKAAVMWMGCYGIGVSRIVAAAIEQNHDERGIIWPEPIAPYDICIVPIYSKQSEQVERISLELHDQLSAAGYEVLLDDREDRPGVKFVDMDLLGIPHRLVISNRGIAHGQVEYKHRASSELSQLPLSTVFDEIKRKLNEPRIND